VLVLPFTVGRSRATWATIVQTGRHVILIGGCIGARHEVMPQPMLMLIAREALRPAISTRPGGARQRQTPIKSPLQIVLQRSEGLKHRRCVSDDMGSDRMPVPSTTTSRPVDGVGGEHLVVAGLEAIIDATAGILAAQSLEATLQAMADALAPIVPYTSLVVYEVDWMERICVPLLATGSYLEQTMNSRPPLDDSATGSAVLSGELVYRGPDDPALGHVMPGTPVNGSERSPLPPTSRAGSTNAERALALGWLCHCSIVPPVPDGPDPSDIGPSHEPFD
jgi:hypothetical protein